MKQQFCVLLTSILYHWITHVAAGSTSLYQAHPAAAYLCRSGNITLRCHYGAHNVLGVVWFINNVVEPDPSTIPGYTVLPRTTTYQEVVVNSYTNLGERYQCAAALKTGEDLTSNVYLRPSAESAKVTLSGLKFVNATATTLSVTWSSSYPKCYSFTVSHSTQDGLINVTQPADSDTSHTLTSLQPNTTYKIEVEAVRKGDGADGQRAKVMGNFITIKGNSKLCKCEEKVEQNVLASAKVSMTCPQTTVTSTVLLIVLSLVLTLSLSTCTVSAVVNAVMYRRLQRCRAELRHGGRDSVKAGPEGEGPPTREEEEEEREKMQANPAYLPIEMMKPLRPTATNVLLYVDHAHSH